MSFNATQSDLGIERVDSECSANIPKQFHDPSTFTGEVRPDPGIEKARESEKDVPSQFTPNPAVSAGVSLQEDHRQHYDTLRFWVDRAKQTGVVDMLVTKYGDLLARLIEQQDTSSNHNTALALSLTGHEGSVLTTAFSPDGSRIASGGDDKCIRVWDASSGECLRVLWGHTDLVRAVAFSADGRRIVSGSADRAVRIWDAETGEAIRILNGHTRPVLCGAFSADDRRVVSGSDDGTVRIWDADTGGLIRTLQGHRMNVRAVAFSPDGARVVSGSGCWASESTDWTVRVWDAETGTTIAILRGHEYWVPFVAFSPDGQHVVSRDDFGNIRVWSGPRYKLSGQSAPPDSWPSPIFAYDPQTRWIVAAHSGSHTRQIYRLRNEDKPIHWTSFLSSHDHTVAIGTKNGRIMVINSAASFETTSGTLGREMQETEARIEEIP